ncbi:hypothetical protein EYR36_010638 [Pleurotus pulmonarius]|nr:hypothetical protein EYR36_010638 [Pleurotus pulmonarius]
MKLSATDLFSLLGLLRSPANRIAPFVQTIVLFNIPAFLRTHGRSDVVRAIRIIPHILALLPHASSLKLWHSDLTRLPEDLALQLFHHFRSFSGTLHLEAVHFHRFVDLANLVTGCTLLRHVSVNCVLWAHPSPPTDRLLLKQSLRAASARWHIHDAGTRYQDLFEWLKSQGSPAPVESMYYHAETPNARSDLNNFLSCCASSLRHLTVSFPLSLKKSRFAEIIDDYGDTSDCINLRSLRMKEVMLVPTTTASRLLQSRISRIIADIPSPHLLESITLELHVSTAVSVEKSLQEFDWNGLTRFRNLRRITLVVDPGLSAEFQDAVVSIFLEMVNIWGFELSEMSFSAFGSKNMFDKRWPLRKERVILYQLAMSICLAAECSATYSLSKYEDSQTNIERLYAREHPDAQFGDIAVHNNPVIAAACVTIVFAVLVATLFGADFFFLLQFPRRVYPTWYNVAKKFLSVFITAGVLAGALFSTVVVATQEQYINGTAVTEAESRRYEEFFYRPPFVYKRWAVNIAWVVLIWIGWVATVGSTIIMWKAIEHDKIHGPGPTSDVPLESTESQRALGGSVIDGEKKTSA